MPSFKTRPNKTLAIGAGIAQGVQNAFTAYNSAKANQMKMSLMQEQIRSQAAYRQAQAEALREKTMPVDMPLSDLYVLGKALKGELLPESVVKGLMKDAGTRLVDSLKNDPSMYPYAAQRIEQVSKVTGAMNAPRPAPQPAQQAPVEPQQDPSNPYAGIRFRANPSTAKFVQGMIGNMTSQNIAAGKNQTTLEVAELTAENRKEIAKLVAENRLDVTDLMNNGKAIVQELRNQGLLSSTDMKGKTQVQVQGMKGQTQTDVAKINAGARTGAAKIGADARIKSAQAKGSKAGTPQDPVLKAKLKVLENEDKELGKNLGQLESPNSPFAMKTPTEKKALKEYWNARRTQVRSEMENISAPQPAAASAANPYAAPKTPLVLAPAPSSKIIPFSNDALKTAPAGTLMKTPAKGWVESLGEGKWQPAKAPEGAE